MRSLFLLTLLSIVLMARNIKAQETIVNTITTSNSTNTDSSSSSISSALSPSFSSSVYASISSMSSDSMIESSSSSSDLDTFDASTSSAFSMSSSSSSSSFSSPSYSSASSAAAMSTSMMTTDDLTSSNLNTSTSSTFSSYTPSTNSTSSSFSFSSSSITSYSASSNTSISILPTSTHTSSSSLSSTTSSFSSSSEPTSSSYTTMTTTFASSSSLMTSQSESLSTYTSDGQVIVTKVYLTLTSTSYSTAPAAHHGLSSKNKKIVAGVVVGVGVPLLILLFWLIYFFLIKGKKQTYIDSQGRVVVDVKRNKFVKYIWCDLFGLSFKSDRVSPNGSQRNSGVKRGASSKTNASSNGDVLGDGVMQMNDVRLARENALLKEQREKGFPTSDEFDQEKNSDSLSNTPELGREIDGNFKGRNSLNTHRRMQSVITGDGFDYLDEINAKKY